MTGIADGLFAELERELRATREVLARVPEDHLAWRPHATSLSLGQLALLVAQVPGNLARFLSVDRLDFATVGFEQPAAQSSGELLEVLDRSFSEARSFFDGADDRGLTATWTLTHGDREILAAPRVELVRYLMLNHWYHHRGQLSVYLRLLGVEVPSIYGPSRDDPSFTPFTA